MYIYEYFKSYYIVRNAILYNSSFHLEILWEGGGVQSHILRNLKRKYLLYIHIIYHIFSQVSELSLELSHVQVQLKGYIAEHESERRKINEEWEAKMKLMEENHEHKANQLYESFVNNHSMPDIERLKTKLEGRETKIRMLEEELNLVKTDGEILAVMKTREEELRQQIELLNKELLEAKKHHTPV